jgi:3-hydroxyacyl-CoA dehydrogenase
MATAAGVKKLAVVGVGIMGSGIARAALLAGYEVVVSDADNAALARGRDVIEEVVRALETEDGFKSYVSGIPFLAHLAEVDYAALMKNPRAVGVFAEGQSGDEIMARLTCEADLSKAVADVDFVIEAVSEVLALKQEVFRQVAESAPAHTVCASNTSTLPVTRIALLSSRPENAIGMHFHGFSQTFNRLVELMPGEKTSTSALDIGMAVGESLPAINGDRLAVRLEKEAAGFIANRIAAPAGLYGTWLMNKAMDEGFTHEQLVAAGQDFRGLDYVGLDTALNASISYQENLSPDFGPSKMVVELVKQGRLGRKSGRGVYRWDADGNMIVEEHEADEKTVAFLEEHSDPDIRLAARLNEACRLLEMGVVTSCEVVNRVEREGESHEGIFVLGQDKYAEWADKLTAAAEKIGKRYLEPCEMMRSGTFRDYP